MHIKIGLEEHKVLHTSLISIYWHNSTFALPQCDHSCSKHCVSKTLDLRLITNKRYL